MSDAYRDFDDLAAHQREGVDFEIEYTRGSTGVLLMAPHGGGIEPGTTPIVRAVAGDEHGYYCFNGTKERANWCLHLTSTRFDEPRALKAVEQADTVVAVHGARDRDHSWTMIGGLDRELADWVTTELKDRDFQVRPCTPGLSAESPSNICNKGRGGAGVQIELSRALRDSFKSDRARLEALLEALRAAVYRRVAAL